MAKKPTTKPAAGPGRNVPAAPKRQPPEQINLSWENVAARKEWSGELIAAVSGTKEQLVS